MDDEKTIKVEVYAVEPRGTIAIGHGRRASGEHKGRYVMFGGDWRPMAQLREAIKQDGPQIADVPTWAIL